MNVLSLILLAAILGFLILFAVFLHRASNLLSQRLLKKLPIDANRLRDALLTDEFNRLQIFFVAAVIGVTLIGLILSHFDK